MMLWLRLLALLLLVGCCCSSVDTNNGDNAYYYLDENSVVLITGAAGFLGSELAMALHRTYSPKKIICVDSMDKGFGMTLGERSEQDLALFEFKRQRVFHLLQTVSTAHFYRVDFRPSIPEFFDTSEVPVLHSIFQEHADITHVVHLADHIHRAAGNSDAQQQVIARIKGQEKAGMMESLLEELRLHRELTGKTPQFIYASSGAVYNHFASSSNTESSPNPPPFSEDKPLTTPSDTAGASKLIDELLAQAYHDVHGIASIGLRFFEVYGPWGLPGSAIFEMAEKAVAGGDPGGNSDNVADYIYIDDAVDGIMAAMQLRIKQPIAINIGTGKGTTLRTIAGIMRKLSDIPDDVGAQAATPAQSVSFASLKRATELLGFEPQITIEEGIEKVLAWHYDRAYPYSGADNANTGSPIAARGISNCSKYDTECLRGTPVFPCASECAHPVTCKTSLYDDVLELTRGVTAKCENVMYTVDLGNDVTHIPSTYVRVSTASIAYVEESSPSSHCNLAFVSEASPLYQKLSHTATPADGVVKHGFWSLIPVAVTGYAQKSVLSLLPKLSPGLFFNDNVKKAIYCDPDVIFDNIHRLLQESNMQPAHPSIQGETVMMIGRKEVDVIAGFQPQHATRDPTPRHDFQQETAYRMIRMAVIDEMTGDGFAQKVDSSFVVHRLRGDNNDDGRLFRCDVFGEVVQWQVDSDRAAFEFIMGLHDMWSRVMVKKSGLEPWWIGDDVSTVPAKGAGSRRRRLQEVVDQGRQLLETDAADGTDEDDEVTGDEESRADNIPDAGSTEQEHNGFGVVQEAIEAVFGYGKQQRFDRPEDGAEADDFVVDDDDGAELNPLGDATETDEVPRYLPTEEKDPSSYDVWMGVLSSTPTRYFSRVVEMEAVGAYRVKDGYDAES